jgi:hypothetical protein
MYEGSCLCGAVKLELLAEPAYASHCHCGMCRKAHGAAFATYVSIQKDQLRYVRGLDKVKSYNSSSTILRKFCGDCGSNLEWCGHPKYPEWTSVPLGLLDTPYTPTSIKELHTDVRVTWSKTE